MTFSSVTLYGPLWATPVSRKPTSHELASLQRSRCQVLSVSKHSQGLFSERVGQIGQECGLFFCLTPTSTPCVPLPLLQLLFLVST